MFLTSLILFAVGLVLIIKGGDWFVDSAVAIAKKTKIPSVVIGATLVSIATTLPELLVSLIASAQGSYGLSVGNAIGSMICNSSLILGLMITIAPSQAEKRLFSKKILFLIFANVVLLVFAINFNIDWWESLLLLLIFAMFVVLNITEMKQKSKLVPGSYSQKDNFVFWKVLLFFVLGATGITVGSFLLVEHGSALASMLGVSEYIIGITLVALGTSLPELVTCIESIKKKNTGLSIGNIIGANVINSSLLIGTSGLVAGHNGLPLATKTLTLSIPVMILSILIVALPILIKGKTYRYQGVLLLTLYASYIFSLIVF